MLLYKMTMAIKLSQSFLNLLSGRMMKFFFFSSSLPESSLSVSQIFSRRMRRRLFSSYVLMVFWCELLDSEKEEEVFFFLRRCWVRRWRFFAFWFDQIVFFVNVFFYSFVFFKRLGNYSVVEEIFFRFVFRVQNEIDFFFVLFDGFWAFDEIGFFFRTFWI